MTYAQQKSQNKNTSANLIKFFKNYKPNIGNALDLGCGIGQDSKYLAQLGYKVDAVDKDPIAIQKSLEWNDDPNIKHIQSDIFKFDFKLKYDLVLAILSLFYSPKQEQKLLFEKIIKNLNKGGMMIIRTLGEKDDRSENINRWSLLEIRTYLNQIKGIDITNIDEEFQTKVTADGTMKYRHFVDVVIEKI